MVYQSLGGDESEEAWPNALRVNLGIAVAINTTVFLLILFRTGQANAESGKKGFNPKKVIELELSDMPQK